MFEKKYRWEMERLSLSQGAMEQIVRAVSQAKQEEEKPVKKVRTTVRNVLVAAAVCAAMALTALAASPTLRQALADALGGFAPYAQNLEGVVEDNGFRLQVLSALTDANHAIVYAQLTDLEGDRLAEANVFGELDLPLAGETSYSFGCGVESYDPETRTALLRFNKDAGAIIPDGAEGEITLSSVQPGYHDFSSQPIPVDHIPNTYLSTMPLSSGETVLLPEQNPLDLPGKPDREGAHLSSAGFAADGRLHYLVRLPEGALPEYCIVLTTTYSKSWKSPEEGADTFFNQDFQSVAFSYEGAVYYDFSTVAALSDWGNIKEITGVYGKYMTAERIDFAQPLRLPVKLSVADAATSPLSGLIDHNTLQELRLSPLGVTILSTSPDDTLIGGYPLTVFLADGSSFHPESGMYGHQKDGPNMARWVFEKPVEVSDMTGIALGCWMIPVENGIAGEGYWLSALPD